MLPILRKQSEIKNEKFVTITLWAEKKDAERYERETFQHVQEIMKPYLAIPMTVRKYAVETALREHFEKALAA